MPPTMINLLGHTRCVRRTQPHTVATVRPGDVHGHSMQLRDHRHLEFLIYRARTRTQTDTQVLRWTRPLLRADSTSVASNGRSGDGGDCRRHPPPVLKPWRGCGWRLTISKMPPVLQPPHCRAAHRTPPSASTRPTARRPSAARHRGTWSRGRVAGSLSSSKGSGSGCGAWTTASRPPPRTGPRWPRSGAEQAPAAAASLPNLWPHHRHSHHPSAAAGSTRPRSWSRRLRRPWSSTSGRRCTACRQGPLVCAARRTLRIGCTTEPSARASARRRRSGCWPCTRRSSLAASRCDCRRRSGSRCHPGTGCPPAPPCTAARPHPCDGSTRVAAAAAAAAAVASAARAGGGAARLSEGTPESAARRTCQPSRRRDCHSAAPPSKFSSCFHRTGEGVSVK